MDTELIIFNEYCQKSHTDPTFIISLEEGATPCSICWNAWKGCNRK